MNKKLTAFEEARKNAKEGKGWFETSLLNYSFVIDLGDSENCIYVNELTTGRLYQLEEEKCPKYMREASSSKLCSIICDKIRKIEE